MAPGFPDFYQGSERPLFHLTDPDNRRPVDFADSGEPGADRDAPLPDPMDPEAKTWQDHQGCLRLLRGPDDIEDFAVELTAIAKAEAPSR